MITVKTRYPGQLHTESTHLQSGTILETDAPTDNKGKGESFSPTDLLATALGTCMLTTVGIKADIQGFNINGATASITKIMSSNPRKVASVKVELDFTTQQYSEAQQEMIRQTALHCPVALSLSESLSQDVSFKFNE